MRKITKESVLALLNGTEFNKQNMSVTRNRHDSGCITMRLHGNTIAQKIGDTIRLKDGGWQTNTTKERLNGILELIGSDLRVKQKDFAWYVVSFNDSRITPFEDGFIVKI